MRWWLKLPAPPSWLGMRTKWQVFGAIHLIYSMHEETVPQTCATVPLAAGLLAAAVDCCWPAGCQSLRHALPHPQQARRSSCWTQ